MIITYLLFIRLTHFVDFDQICIEAYVNCYINIPCLFIATYYGGSYPLVWTSPLHKMQNRFSLKQFE